MFFYGRIIILFHSLSSKSRNSKVFTNSDFKMALKNSESVIPDTYKTGLIKSLLFRCFNLCSDFVKLHYEINDLSILASNNNDFKFTLMENPLINRDHSPLNKNRHSLPLELFDD